MKLNTSKIVEVGDSKETLNLSWRDLRYHRFYKIVDQLVNELEQHIWISTAKPKRIFKGDSLKKLHYSVEC